LPDERVRSSFQVPAWLPKDALAHYFFASDWNAFIFVGANSASFAWQELSSLRGSQPNSA